jgi:hypothetical protein
MRKILIATTLALVLSVAFVPISNAQMAKKGWEKTVTLPRGEVILDMSGEWDMLNEGYGPFSFRAPITDILTITQEGTTFTAVKQIGSQWVPKGAETIKGELDKDGFKAVYCYTHVKEWWTYEFIWEPCKWEITENGNKVVLDCGERIKTTLTRK